MIRFEYGLKVADTKFIVASFQGQEALSELFSFDLVLEHEKIGLSVDGFVGRKAALDLTLVQSEVADVRTTRSVTGVLASFQRCHDVDGHFYRARLVPPLFRTTLRRDVRIFQHLDAPTIVKQVLERAGVEAAFRLTGTYEQREFCVQYRETDFDFLRRLCAEEGIAFAFDHAEGSRLTFVDAPQHESLPGDASLPFQPRTRIHDDEALSHFEVREELRSGKVTLTDFAFAKPNLSLLGSEQAKKDHDLEVYDWPGEYETPALGRTRARVRLDALQATRTLATGMGNSIRFAPGLEFKVADHPVDELNAAYQIVAVRHEGSSGGTRSAGTPYQNAFEAIAADVHYRPSAQPRPVVHGVQTAIVVGPAGSEIHVDEHGRVKVQFHWDRAGQRDENASCWIRVSQSWAGAGYGGMLIPRIGHEVIVDFLEGDPDRPIITGRVYHGTNVPPYALPGEHTKSTLKSHSSPGGNGDNELRFEDKKGSEEIYLHAEKDFNVVVENDETHAVGHDRTRTVGHDESVRVDHDLGRTIGHDELHEVGRDRTIRVGRHQSATVGQNETMTIGGSAERSVGGDETRSVGGNDALEVGGTQTQTIAAARADTVGGAYTVTVGAALSQTVGGNLGVSVGGNASSSVGGDQQATVGKNLTTTVGKEAKTTVADKYTLQVGDASITIAKDGTVTVAGKDVTVNGSGTITVKASSKLVLKSSGPVTVEGGSQVKIKGSAIGMN